MKFEFEGNIIELTQEAYITGLKGKKHYEAHAIDINDNEYIVKWDILDCWKDKIDECDDESNLCDWANPTEIIKL